MSNNVYYAILVIGGKYYTIRKVLKDIGIHFPVSGISHKSLKDAMEEARILKFEVEKIGESYQII